MSNAIFLHVSPLKIYSIPTLILTYSSFLETDSLPFITNCLKILFQIKRVKNHSKVQIFAFSFKNFYSRRNEPVISVSVDKLPTPPWDTVGWAIACCSRMLRQIAHLLSWIDKDKAFMRVGENTWERGWDRVQRMRESISKANQLTYPPLRKKC